MDQERAKSLFESGAIFLLLDVPPDTEFGIDYHCWRTGPNFKGVKMIPPGWHFIYYSAVDKNGQVGARNGFFHHFKSKEVVAKRWNPQSETIEKEDAFNEEQMRSFEANKKDMDRFLGPYPFDEYKRWISLTNHFTDELINELLPESKAVSSESCLVGKRFESKGKAKENVEELFQVPKSMEEAERRIPEMEEMPGTLLRFTSIPSESFPKGATGVEITRHMLDTSYRLKQFIENQKRRLIPNGSQSEFAAILCELEFSFICFIVGQNLSAFEQWKRIFFLLTNAEAALIQHCNLYLHFVQTLYFQMKEMPENLLGDELLIEARDNFLTVNLHNFFDNVETAGLEDRNAATSPQSLLSRLKDKCKDFKNYLQEKFKFDFEEEPDEYAPVICDQNLQWSSTFKLNSNKFQIFYLF